MQNFDIYYKHLLLTLFQDKAKLLFNVLLVLSWNSYSAKTDQLQCYFRGNKQKSEGGVVDL